MRRPVPYTVRQSLSCLILAIGLTFSGSLAALAANAVKGDLDANGGATVSDAIRLIRHLDFGDPLSAATMPLGDLDQSGGLTRADLDREVRVILGHPEAVAATFVASSPGTGEVDVAVSRETIVRFRRALRSDVVPTAADVFATVAGEPLAARLHLGADRRSITLFYLLRLPASTRIRVTIDGTRLLDVYGSAIDVDGDGAPGGIQQVDFDTLTLSTVPGTSVYGRVFASEPGEDGAAAVDTPLPGVSITVDGMEATMHALTDVNGNFTLDPSPAGPFFVHVHGPNATEIGADAYYPEVGKLWHAEPGVPTSVGNVYLPLITNGTMQDVSLNAETQVAFPASVIAKFPEYQGVGLSVPPDTPYSDAGERGGQLGIAPVAPDRLPGKLPVGLDFPLVITVQASAGLTNFDRPVPACFPNLPDPNSGETLGPGAKTALWSFDHDIGEWKVVGPMTISADGDLACTDPGVGVLAPGWHGANGGGPGDGPPGPPDPPADPPPPGPPGPPGGPDDPPPRPPPPCPEDPREIRQGIYLCATGNGLKALGCISFSQAAEGCGRLKIIPKFICKQFGKDVKDCVKDGIGDGKSCADHFKKCMDDIGDNGVAGSFPAPSGDVIANADSGPGDSGLIDTAAADNVAAQLYAHLQARLNLETTIAALIGNRTDEAQLSPSELAQLTSLMAQHEALFLGMSEEEFYAAKRTEMENVVADGLTTGLIHLSDERAYFALEQPDLENGIVQRGRTENGGAMARMLLRPNTLYVLHRLFPKSLTYSRVTFWSAPTGQPTAIPRGGLDARVRREPDADGDGLTTDMEFVVGTDVANPDSDDDELRDGDELAADLDPLEGRPSRTGIVATVSFPELSDAQDLCSDDGMVAVAAGADGVAVFNVFQSMPPARIAQVDTPGLAQRVACAGMVQGFGVPARRLLAAADGPGGLAIIDVSDPPTASILHQIPLGYDAQAVAVGAGIAYVGLINGDVVSIDLFSGALLERVALGEEVRDLSVGASGDGQWLYALTPTHIVPIDVATDMMIMPPVVSPTGGPINHRLFIGSSVAHAIHGKGMNTFDLGDPSLPVLIAAGLTTQFGWKQIALNGSGLGIAAVSPNQAFDGPHEINVYDVSDPLQTEQFIAQFLTPGVARSVIVNEGLAYVVDTAYGDAPGALHVMNYLPRETAHSCPVSCPSILLATNFMGGQVEEGKIVRLTASVADDVQVRQVEFFVDLDPVVEGDIPATKDGSYPFQHYFRAPLRTASLTTLHVRARVIDTAGNATWTPDLPLTISPDATPPRVVSTTPFLGALAAGTRVVSARFNEPLATETLNEASFLVAGLGLGAGGADLAVSGHVGYSSASNAATFTVENPLSPGRYRARVLSSVKDLTGNPLSAIYEWIFRVVGGIDSDGDGMSDDYEAAYGLNPAQDDQNGNGQPDGYDDFDGDGLRNDAEAALLHDVSDADSDAGSTPGNENDNGINDANEDADHDGLTNAREVTLRTDPLSSDTDRDGIGDGDEVDGWGSNPLDPLSREKPFARHSVSAFLDVPGGGSVRARSTPVRATPVVQALLTDVSVGTPFGTREVVLSSPDLRILTIEYLQGGRRAPDAVLSTPEIEATLSP